MRSIRWFMQEPLQVLDSMPRDVASRILLISESDFILDSVVNLLRSANLAKPSGQKRRFDHCDGGWLKGDH